MCRPGCNTLAGLYKELDPEETEGFPVMECTRVFPCTGWV